VAGFLVVLINERQRMFSLIIEAAKAAFDVAGKWQEGGKERRANLANHFERISAILKDFVQSARQGKQAEGPCARLAVSAESIRNDAKQTLGDDEVERLANELTNACKNWQAVTGAPGTPSYASRLVEIEKAAGTFEGFADRLRAK
jgi:hypothetical protein